MNMLLFIAFFALMIAGVPLGVSMGLSATALVVLTDLGIMSVPTSVYTGIAYLITVALLVLPYLLLPDNLWAVALVMMIAIVVLIILGFNYYISVAKSVPFRKRFVEMVSISMGVMVIAFLIGLLAKALLGVNL